MTDEECQKLKRDENHKITIRLSPEAYAALKRIVIDENAGTYAEGTECNFYHVARRLLEDAVFEEEDHHD